MKPLFLASALIASLVLHGCEQGEEELLDLSDTSFSGISCEGTTLEISVSGNVGWSVTEVPQWCVAEKQDEETQVIQIGRNYTLNPRHATVVVAGGSGDISQTIVLYQDAFDPETHVYRIPVIFHVLYHDINDPKQYVSTERLPEILEEVNRIWRSTGSGNAGMGVEFVLAAKDPQGQLLPEPGVERISWETEEVDIYHFIDSNSGIYENTDYCTDTYSCNRKEYEEALNSVYQSLYTFEELVQRYDCARNKVFT